ncbi:MAG: hypothetical protein OSB57_01825 [Planctomycetota bacterium]|nr:hypothetical protein [Planctomycetota bacterium]
MGNLGTTPWCNCAPELSLEDGAVTLMHRAAVQRMVVPETMPWELA